MLVLLVLMWLVVAVGVFVLHFFAGVGGVGAIPGVVICGVVSGGDGISVVVGVVLFLFLLLVLLLMLMFKLFMLLFYRKTRRVQALLVPIRGHLHNGTVRTNNEQQQQYDEHQRTATPPPTNNNTNQQQTKTHT